MDTNDVFGALTNAMVDLQEASVVANTKKGLEAGIGPLDIIENGLLPGLNKIGDLFESEEIFLPELMQSATIFQAAMAILPDLAGHQIRGFLQKTALYSIIDQEHPQSQFVPAAGKEKVRPARH